MSAARVGKLKALLSRVQERRAQPRLKAVAAEPEALAEAAPAPTTLPDLPRISVVPSVAVTAPPPVSPAEEAAALFASASSAPPNAAHGSDVSRQAPTMEDLPSIPPLDKLPAAASLEVKAPPAAAPKPVPETRRSESEDLFEVPARSVAPVEPALEPELSLTAPSARIQAEPITVTAPVARVVAPARIEAPKTFGELLEMSLSLRPR